MGDKLHHIKQNIKAFLLWWMGELAGIIPSALKGVLFPAEKTVRIIFRKNQTKISFVEEDTVKTKTFSVSFPEILQNKTFRNFLSEELGQPVTIILSPELTLQRQIILPKAAKNSFENIVKLQLPSLLPMAEENIHYGCLKAEDEGDEMITISIAMIKKSLSQQITEIFSGAGLKVKAITGLSAMDQSRSFTFLNLGQKYKNIESQLVAGLVVSCFILISLFMAGTYYHLTAREEFLSAKMKALSKEAQSIEALSGEIQNFEQQQALYQSKIDHLRLDEILATLTELLPDDSWVFDFAQNGNRLSLTGKTANASLLAEKIDSNSLFKNVTISSTRIEKRGSNTARERFVISFELVREGPDV